MNKSYLKPSDYPKCEKSKLKEVLPKAKRRVGEIWRTVKVSEPQTASDVVHAGQSAVGSLHDASLNETLIGAVAKSHQTVVIIQTEKKNETFVNTLDFFSHCLFVELRIIIHILYFFL